LAMSSRNRYLNAEEREAATVLFRALTLAQELYTQGERNAQNILSAMHQIISTEPKAQVDYIAINDAENLHTLTDLVGRPALVSLAVKIGSTRLIDNLLLQ
jgi:pantoate--beta-alanine ligase